MSGHRYMKKNFVFFFIMILSMLTHSSVAQNARLKKKIQIDYLAIQVDIDESRFTSRQIQYIKLRLEAMIADHNNSDPKFKYYIVDELRDGQMGITLHLDTMITPTKSEQRTAFIISMFGLIATPIGVLYATSGEWIFLFWVNPRNQILERTILSPSLSLRGGEALKMRISNSGGWFRQTIENEYKISNYYGDRVERLLRQIHTNYRPPKEVRHRKALELGLPEKFIELEEKGDMVSDLDEKLKDTGLVQQFIVEDTIDETKREGIYYWSFDMSSGVFIPVAGDINYSFVPGFSMRIGPEWRFAKGYRFKPFVGFDILVKYAAESSSRGERYLNSRYGLQLEKELFPRKAGKIELNPFVNLSYCTGFYRYKYPNVNDGLTNLKHQGWSFGAGLGMNFKGFTVDFYYNYYMPNFGYKSGTQATDLGNDYDLDFDRHLNMSTIEIQLGIALH